VERLELLVILRSVGVGLSGRFGMGRFRTIYPRAACSRSLEGRSTSGLCEISGVIYPWNRAQSAGSNEFLTGQIGWSKTIQLQVTSVDGDETNEPE
jgi:hypothetical protein